MGYPFVAEFPYFGHQIGRLLPWVASGILGMYLGSVVGARYLYDVFPALLRVQFITDAGHRAHFIPSWCNLLPTLAGYRVHLGSIVGSRCLYETLWFSKNFV